MFVFIFMFYQSALGGKIIGEHQVGDDFRNFHCWIQEKSRLHGVGI
jgi:hypothetical protein